ncbi:MAG: hypothetical protein U9P72_03445 [Campylobacterota bacterium]|nr:hypothetical protein [Campylobacterota bacterium]
MIKIVAMVFIFVTNLFSNDIFNNYDITYTTLLYSESEQIEGKENNDFEKERSDLSSWFNQLNVNYWASDNFYISLGSKANVVLNETPYKTPTYTLSKQNKKQLNKIDISEATMNYDNNFISFNLGRIDVNFDWLSGSIDGVLVSVGDDKKSSLRIFWFDTFTQQGYNNYFKVEDINDENGLYGTIFKTKKSAFELTLYDYYMQDLRNTAGVHLNYTKDYFGFDFIYTDVKALSLAIYDYDESLAQFSLEYIYGHNYIELGGSYTGENGLLAMTQMGTHIVGEFYMTNQINRQKAKNIYMKYIYLSSNWYLKLLAGASKYNNSFISLETNLKSFEIDAYYRYYFNKLFFINVGIMGMDVDERDPISFSKFSTTLTLGYKYELF